LDLAIQEARMRRQENGAALGMDENGQPVRPMEVINATFDGKVTVASGNAVAATGVRTQSTSGQQTLMIVTATVQQPEGQAGK
jgi:hypothetical protein